MTKPDRPTRDAPIPALTWPLRLTRWGMIAERVTRGFWPLWTILLIVLAALMLGFHDEAPIEWVWAGAGVATVASIVALIMGGMRLRIPSRAEAQDRLDATLPGRPIAALSDDQAIGASDDASRAVWDAHQKRMAERAAAARAPKPDLRLSQRDPYALRYVAVLAFLVAVLFGSVLRLTSVTTLTPGGGDQIASGPSWEGWIEPPAYTGMPSLYLNDLVHRRVTVPENSLVSIRLYGEAGALSVTESVTADGRAEATDAEQSFDVTTGGKLTITGVDNAEWTIVLLPDVPPSVSLDGDMDIAASGEMRQPFRVLDDYGVVSGHATLTLELDQVDRRHGLAIDPDPRDPVRLDLPMTISGDRGDFDEILVDNFSRHPWSGLPVTLSLEVEDAVGQTGQSTPMTLPMPGRRFFDPLAKSVIEGRRDLLWSRDNGRRVAEVLRAITHRPDGFMRTASAYLMLRVAIRRVEAGVDEGMPTETQDALADALWDIAVLLEDGNLSDALERMRRAQDRLAEAMRDGASDEEIQQLMDELREATQDYMRQLAQNPEEGQDSAQNQNMQQLTQQDLQDMMDRIQELMEQGRMAEAQELLDQLAEMMENMRVAEGGENQQQGPGQQAMEDLSETLRNQQGLSDEAFRSLQEQFNPNAQAGESQENEGRSGGQGRGESHEGQSGEGPGEDGEQQGEQGSRGAQSGQGLADRQEALRQELQRQQNALPGAGTQEGESAREALGRAERAMENAEQALRENDLAEALDDQAEAMEALREGMRQLGDALARDQQNQGQQGQAEGQAQRDSRDPLGRTPGINGGATTEERLLQGGDVYRRAKELLDELRERSSDQSRPKRELEYLKRLLDRF
ncbi:TIGR02302 family protein [Aliiroseovarius sp. YM-037]|uniref:TIGR02302 family protein n=1 Tax=Aliiroseovarius sp. YM-037 TaxID=3341728 RepID=UPI003A800AA0